MPIDTIRLESVSEMTKCCLSSRTDSSQVSISVFPTVLLIYIISNYQYEPAKLLLHSVEHPQ